MKKKLKELSDNIDRISELIDLYPRNPRYWEILYRLMDERAELVQTIGRNRPKLLRN